MYDKSLFVKKYYYGFRKTMDIKNSSSGGLAANLYEYVIKNNGVVYGVEWSNDFSSAVYKRAETLEEISKLRGSKYVKASLFRENGNIIFESVLDDLISGREVLFIGLPCEIFGLKTYLKQNSEDRMSQLITVDMVCQGPINAKAVKQYVFNMEKKYKSKIIDLNMRYKNPYWGENYLRILFSNGRLYLQKLYKTEIGVAFALMGDECSFKCNYKGNHRASDITLGDYWGALVSETNYNAMGMSLAVAHTREGDSLLKKLDNFQLFETDFENALKGNPYYSVARQKPKEQVKYVDDFNKYGLKKASYRALGLKRLILYCFSNVYRGIKRIKE